MYALTTRVYLEPITKEYIEVFQVEPKPKAVLVGILKHERPLKQSPLKGLQSGEG